MLMIYRLLLVIFVLSGCAEQASQKPVTNDQSQQLPISSSEKPKPSTTIKNKESYYTVKKGDTLYSIGIRTGLGYWQIAEWNNIGSNYKVLVGQKLKLFKGIPTYADKAIEQPSKIVDLPPKTEQKKSIISNNREKVLKLHWQWPLRGKIIRDFAATNKKGIDIEATLGQSVFSVEEGEVVYSGSGLIGYGQLIIIKHDKLFLSAYANNESALVKEGQVVAQGQEIARCGNGRTGKPSLYFEIRKNGKSVDPLQLLPAR